jgi:hypothetical protein
MSLEPIKSSAPARGGSVGGRRKSVGEEPVSSVLRAGEVITYERELTADEEVLAALGYKPEFKREFSLWTSFCVSFAVLGLLPSFASTLYYGMPERLSLPGAHFLLRAYEALSHLEARTSSRNVVHLY